MHAVLEKLGLEAVNVGTWFGSEPHSDESAPLIESSNPATDEVIASVRATTMEQYEEVIAAAQESFIKWRTVPAPIRGEAVRNIANALRKHKDALGSLVALENGKEVRFDNEPETGFWDRFGADFLSIFVPEKEL